ncbi:hypothetical protein AB0D08_27140 [Kitasatospora sp. NPDC048540]|uniref:hypothetical protein n=1 Tax=Kitasatospora sp. NPDC048540 TaxID=3155634 RepID=UPI0033E3C6CA
MSTNRSRRIDRETAEQLLAGAGADPEAGRAAVTGHPALAGLLAAAAAPAADGEAAGERQALAAFREARLTSAAATGSARPTSTADRPRRRTMADTALARAFSAKALAAAFAVTALGGVAVAAGTGSLPPALGGAPAPVRPPVSAPAVPAATGSAGPGARPSGSATASAPPAQARPGGSAPASGPAPAPGASTRPEDGPTSAAPSVDAASAAPDAPLCRSLRDRLRAGERLADLLKEQALQRLSRSAGGNGRTAGYCAAVLHEDFPGDGSSDGQDGSSGGNDVRPPGQPKAATATPSPSGGRRG